MFDSIVVLGPTASGKTKLAVKLAQAQNGEILSIDSRMVYKGMDIGTGKDLKEYTLENSSIPYHLIDLVTPEFSYHIHTFQLDFKLAFSKVKSKEKLPILCGGSGLYLDAVIHDFLYTSIPIIPEFKEKLLNLSHPELIDLYNGYQNHSFKEIADLGSIKRAIRAIEILEYLNRNPDYCLPEPKPINPFVIGITPDRSLLKINILNRLQIRLQEGLIEEVQSLLEKGIKEEKLIHFGLEYKFVMAFLQKKINKEELFEKLGIAIIQFSKRQMTYFRKMEKGGLKIHWFKNGEEAITFFNSENVSFY